MRYPAGKFKPYTSRDARERANLVEAARRALPVNTYLAMLNHAALTGELPIVDTMTGQLTSQTEKISLDQRLDLARFLIDKSMPNLIRIEPPTDDGLKDVGTQSLTQDDVATLPSDMLKALIAANSHIVPPASTTTNVPATASPS